MSLSPKSVTRAEISLSALRHNLGQLRRRLAPGAKMLLVVKSDAYGHGMVTVARAAQREPAVVYFGVAAADEALELRRAGIRKPVLLLAPAHPSRLRELVAANITFAVSTIGEARGIDRAARAAGKRVKLHAEVDTGMGRLGADYTEALEFLFALQKLESVDLEGAYTHFSGADDPGTQASDRQIRIFRMAVELFRELYPGVLQFAHAANSAGTFRFKDAHFNLVRPGLAVYGVNPMSSRLPAGVHLKPVLSLKTRIACLRPAAAGTTVSYHSLYRTRRPSLLATLPVGYSSGYPLRLSNRSRVLIGGQSFPIAGRVTMDQIVVDLGGFKGARLWDEAVLIGASGRERITAEELAAMAGTIPYEILCGIHTKIPRIPVA